MKQPNFKTILIIFTGIFLNSCNLDIIENHYSDYENAIKNDFNGNGYIPEKFMKKSIKDIRTILNIDINEAMIKFQISDSLDWKNLINELEKCNIKFIEPKSFKIPNWWDVKVNESNVYCYTDKYGETFHFVIDSDSKRVYSWNVLE
jgi:hypothetical protein